MANDTMIRVQRSTVARIAEKKIVRNETHDEVINRAIDAMERLAAINALNDLQRAVKSA